MLRLSLMRNVACTVATEVYCLLHCPLLWLRFQLAAIAARHHKITVDLPPFLPFARHTLPVASTRDTSSTPLHTLPMADTAVRSLATNVNNDELDDCIAPMETEQPEWKTRWAEWMGRPDPVMHKRVSVLMLYWNPAYTDLDGISEEVKCEHPKL